GAGAPVDVRGDQSQSASTSTHRRQGDVANAPASEVQNVNDRRLIRLVWKTERSADVVSVDKKLAELDEFVDATHRAEGNLRSRWFGREPLDRLVARLLARLGEKPTVALLAVEMRRRV